MQQIRARGLSTDIFPCAQACPDITFKPYKLALLAGNVALKAQYFHPANCSSSISFDWS